jgi:hypothetical protein
VANEILGLCNNPKHTQSAIKPWKVWGLLYLIHNGSLIHEIDDKSNIRNYVNMLGLVTSEEVNMIKQAGFKKPRTLTTKINKVVTKLAKTIWSARNVKMHS